MGKKTCLMCKYFYFSSGSAGYSEVTPGSDTYMGCDKNHWQMEEDEEKRDLRHKMSMAACCNDYIYYKEENNNAN